jgi:hypothetical protein
MAQSRPLAKDGKEEFLSINQALALSFYALIYKLLSSAKQFSAFTAFIV